MKRSLLIVLVGLLSVSLLAFDTVEWHSETLQIYADTNADHYGHAHDRSRVLSHDLYDFILGRSLNVADNKGFLTAVTVSHTVKTELEYLLKEVAESPARSSMLRIEGFYNSITINGRSLYLVSKGYEYDSVTHQTEVFLPEPYYVYQEKERGIRIAFSLEKASDKLLDFIDEVYAKEPEMASKVKDHYRKNYVIRIYQANSIESRDDTLSLYDIMFSATALGERKQLLIGIHDGTDILADLNTFYRNSSEYKVFLNQPAYQLTQRF
jgi:hypothetical protein